MSRFLLICLSFILLAGVFLGLLDLPANQQIAEVHIQGENIQKNQLLDSIKSKITELKIEELFWQNRIQLAAEKKISLVLDLSDSLVLLENNGVTLRQSKVIYYTKSSLIDNSEKFLPWLKSPFTLLDDSANFLKEPIKTKTLTKEDTTFFGGYHNNQPDTNLTIFFRLNYDRNLSITFLQGDLPYFGVWQENIYAYIYDTCVEELPTKAKYWINIFLSRSDIVALYRALFPNCKLILRT